MKRVLLGLVAAIACVMPAHAWAFPFEASLGVKGGMNSTAVRGVPEGDPITINGQDYVIPQGPDLYPMFGLGGGVGPFLELRIFDIGGIETGVHWSWDNGAGWEDKNANGFTIGRVNQEQRTRSLRIPIMAKAAVPGFVRPTFGLGLEIVKQLHSTLTYRSDKLITTQYENTYAIKPSTYTTLAFSFALEIDLGEVRIPIEIRGNYNVGFRKGFNDRATATAIPPVIEYDGVYEGHLALYTGIIYGFELDL